MFSWLADAWRVPELRRRVIFTFTILALYRLGSWIPAPGVDSNTIKDYFNGRIVLIVVTLTAGTTLLMWMGELITKRGVGNGISLLIFASILSSAPTGIAAWYNGGTMERLFFPLVALGIIAAVVVFTYFYTAVQFNPVDQADNLRRYGGYIPGIRPGAPTAQYLDRVLTRLTLPGSLYLALVAVLPSVFFRYGGFSQATSRALGGTSVLIVVGVALDTMRQMESQMMMRSYEGFLK